MAASTSSSLVVKISADLNDFSKQLNQMTRDVDRASKKVAEVGKALTLGITLPVTAAAAALAKMAAENEDVGGRVERVFGSMASSVNASIKLMMQSVPETQTDLQKMAISLDNMAQGLGLAPQNAARMSESLLKLAGDASAFAHVPMEQALDALGRGLAGKTKGLLEFGIAINESDIKQRAMQMGLLNTGNQLTETGTALAAYSLIMEKAGRITGEAARTAEQSGKQFAFLKRDLSELADQVSSLVLPSLSGFAREARSVVDVLAGVPEPVTKTIFAVAAVAAVAGPTIFALSKLAKTYVELRSGISLLQKGGSLVGFFASLTNPVTATIVALGALTVAILALYEAYKKLRGASASDLLAQAHKDLNSDPTLVAALKKQGVIKEPGGTNAPTQFNPKDQFSQFSENVNLLGKAFDSAIEHGERLSPIFQQIIALQKVGADLADKTGGAFTKQADELRSASAELQKMADVREFILSGNPQDVINKIVNRPIDVGGAGAQASVDAANKYRLDLAQRLGASSINTFNAQAEGSIAARQKQFGTANDLALREELLKLPDGFDAARQAAVELAEAQRSEAETTALEFEKIKIKLGPLGNALNGLSSGVQNVVVTLYNSVQSFAQSLVASIGGSGKGAATGRGIGGLIGSVVGSIGGPVGSAIGGAIGTAAGGAIGGLFDHAKKSTDGAATSMDALAKTVDRVTASITNVPQFFKVETYRFEAAPTSGSRPPNTAGTPSAPGGSTWTPPTPNDPRGGHHGDGNANVVIQNFHASFPGVSSAQDFIQQLADLNLRRQATGAAGTFAFSGGATL